MPFRYRDCFIFDYFGLILIRIILTDFRLWLLTLLIRDLIWLFTFFNLLAIDLDLLMESDSIWCNGLDFSGDFTDIVYAFFVSFLDGLMFCLDTSSLFNAVNNVSQIIGPRLIMYQIIIFATHWYTFTQSRRIWTSNLSILKWFIFGLVLLILLIKLTTT